MRNKEDMKKIIRQKYDKKALTIDEQVGLLNNRGLVIEDPEELRYYLRHISYYHLSIYFKHYQRDDLFYSGVGFRKDILRIYKFDNKLRFLLIDLLERVEKSFKCRMVYELSVEGSGSHWYLEQDFYKSREGYREVLNLITGEVNKSNELSIKHYVKKYSEPVLPPIWTVLEILSFGQCLKIYGSLRHEYKNKIAQFFGEDEKFITNWMLCASFLRNTCAHYSRLWNRRLVIIPKTKHRAYEGYFVNNNKLYNYLVVLQILLSTINPTSSWLDRLKNLIGECGIDVKNMGFPDNWEKKLREIKSIK